MFFRKLICKKGGQKYTYLKLVENYRLRGKILQRTLVNFGNITSWPREKVKELIIKMSQITNVERPGFFEDVNPESVLEFGPHYLINHFWEKLDLSNLLQHQINGKKVSFDVIMAIKTMVFNRLINPKSKYQVNEWAKDQFIPDESKVNTLKVHHYYRALDYLTEATKPIEKAIYNKVVNLFNLDLSLIFYDLTSSYFEGNGCPLANWGYSRDHRPDCKQIQIGLVVTKDGIPIAHEVFEGNIKDQTTLGKTLEELRTRFNINQCIFVADDGIICNSTFEELENANYKYITSLSLRKSKEATALISLLPKIEEFQKVKDNMYIKELTIDNGFNYIAVYNPIRAEQTLLSRQQRIAESESFLERYIKKPAKHKMTKPDKLLLQIVKHLRRNKTYKFFHVEHIKDGKFSYTKRADMIKREESIDGLQILKTNAKELTSREIALGYRTLAKVENAFNEIKNFLRIRPIRHFTDIRVKGHVFVCVIAYLLEQLIEQALESKGVKISASTVLEKMLSIKVVTNELMGQTIRKVVAPTTEQKQILKSVGIIEVPTIV